MFYIVPIFERFTHFLPEFWKKFFLNKQKLKLTFTYFFLKEIYYFNRIIKYKIILFLRRDFNARI